MQSLEHPPGRRPRSIHQEVNSLGDAPQKPDRPRTRQMSPSGRRFQRPALPRLLARRVLGRGRMGKFSPERRRCGAEVTGGELFPRVTDGQVYGAPSRLELQNRFFAPSDQVAKPDRPPHLASAAAARACGTPLASFNFSTGASNIHLFKLYYVQMNNRCGTTLLYHNI